jgi:hypothetical protein
MCPAWKQRSATSRDGGNHDQVVLEGQTGELAWLRAGSGIDKDALASGDTITWRSRGDKPDGTGGVIYAVQDGVQVEDIPAGWQGKVPWHRVASPIPKEH